MSLHEIAVQLVESIKDGQLTGPLAKEWEITTTQNFQVEEHFVDIVDGDENELWVHDQYKNEIEYKFRRKK